MDIEGCRSSGPCPVKLPHAKRSATQLEGENPSAVRLASEYGPSHTHFQNTGKPVSTTVVQIEENANIGHPSAASQPNIDIRAEKGVRL
jgi:hypothetical protein